MSSYALHLIAGARPNFMKVAPLVRAARARDHLTCKIIHTGQHYDRDMSDVFFEELGIPHPSHYLGCGGGSHAEQTAKIMIAYESLCRESRPDMVVVVGDVNSTLACAIVAKKLNVPVAHIEAGLRSGDRTMPEEINRLATDAISDLLFATEPSALSNLLKEGHQPSTIYHVGNLMIDNLYHQKALLDACPVREPSIELFKQKHPRYGVVTLHRPSNVDDIQTLAPIIAALTTLSEDLPLAFPVHPRTQKTLVEGGINLGPNITSFPPLSFMSFLNLWKDSVLVLTDSGGIQEETTALGIRCVTIRENTERPVTIDQGTNILAGISGTGILEAASRSLAPQISTLSRPDFWDGNAAGRIVDAIASYFSGDVMRSSTCTASARP